MTNVTISVNGEARSDDVDPRLLLVHYLRDNRRLTGTHVGCDTSNCGACTILVDGEPAKSCTLLAVQADGAEVTTVEGLATDGRRSAVQEGFHQKHGLQCGYCTSGFLVAATSLLQDNPAPTDQEIREGLEGNLCRCTGYAMIVESVRWAAENPDGLPDPSPAEAAP